MTEGEREARFKRPISPRQVHLAHSPTPIEKRPALDQLLGVDLWIKRDDCIKGVEAGNKVRKLEFLLADAIDRGADTLVTCGGIQSNHARATALFAAEYGLRTLLFLRVDDERLAGDGLSPTAPALLGTDGNLLLDRLVGAEIRLISGADYAHRTALMEAAAADLSATGHHPYVVPEGGSNGLGSLGYVEAMRETGEQIHLGLAGKRAPFDVIVHACGSGGTAAGVALGARHYGVADSVRPMAVCNDSDYFEAAIARIEPQARAFAPWIGPSAAVTVDDHAKGPRYAVMSADQRAFLVKVARCSGLILDPCYTGKALFGLGRAVERGDIPRGARVLFIHTGGLPGLLAAGADFASDL